jgi:hypothetical protein
MGAHASSPNLKFLKNKKSKKNEKYLKGPVREGKVALLLIFGKFLKNGAFFVFTVCPESLTVLR